jgi:hypothetical protein
MRLWSVRPPSFDLASADSDSLCSGAGGIIKAHDSLLPFGSGIQDMLEKAQAVQALADTLERLGAPLGLPEDWIVLCDVGDLRPMQRQSAKRLLAQAKKETARRWLWQRFDPAEMDLELSQECQDDDFAEEFDERLLKQHALNSIDDVVSTVNSLREAYANLL